VWNQSPGAVLADPFPGTVIRGFVLVLAIINSQLPGAEMDFVQANHPVRSRQGAVTTRIDCRIGMKLFEFNVIPIIA
jgi:hypothetical protein